MKRGGVRKGERGSDMNKLGPKHIYEEGEITSVCHRAMWLWGDTLHNKQQTTRIILVRKPVVSKKRQKHCYRKINKLFLS